MAPHTRTKTYEWFQQEREGGAVLLCTDVAARGLDVPDIDWIVQFDAPQDPNAFVHRVGRTARMGRSGRALLLLRPKEDTYVNFLSLRKVPLLSMEPEPNLPSLRRPITDLLLADRAVMEQSAKAFVAYVRAYKEHQCGYIFSLDQLDLGELARGLALLRLPKLKELQVAKRKKGADGWVEWSPLVQVDLDTIKFKDKQREKQRQANKAAAAAAAAAEASGAPTGGAAAAAGGRSAAGAAAGKGGAKEEARPKKAREESAAAAEEDMAREAGLMKKLKRGKITQAQFDKLMGEASDESGEEEEEEARPPQPVAKVKGAAARTAKAQRAAGWKAGAGGARRDEALAGVVKKRRGGNRSSGGGARGGLDPTDKSLRSVRRGRAKKKKRGRF